MTQERIAEIRTLNAFTTGDITRAIDECLREIVRLQALIASYRRTADPVVDERNSEEPE